MSRRTALAGFRERQRQIQLAVSTVAADVVMLDVESGEFTGGNLECRFQPRRARGARIVVRLRERWGYKQDDVFRDWYSYSLAQADGPEVLSYHLHPATGPYEAEHLHLGGGAGELIPELVKSHLPTGPVSMPAFIQLLIRDFAVRAIRDDWREILASQVADP